LRTIGPDSIFIDIDSIPVGCDFREASQWSTIRNAHLNRRYRSGVDLG
jgi:hypothetical protein